MSVEGEWASATGTAREVARPRWDGQVYNAACNVTAGPNVRVPVETAAPPEGDK